MHKILHLIAKLDKEGEAPEWMLLFAAGWGELADGVKFFVDRQAFDLVAAMVQARGNEVVFDYEHQTIKGDKAPAAGWIKELKWDEGKGILARVEWTDEAAGYIARGEYRYFSPVFFIRKTDRRVCGLHSSALTNTPKTNNLTPILAKLEAGLGKNKEESMNREQLIAALGLKEDATDAEILAAVAKAGVEMPKAESETKKVIPEKVTAALGLSATDGESAVVASIHALKQGAENGVSVVDFKALQDRLAERDAKDAVAAAAKAGKITPAQSDWAMAYAKDDLAGFNAFVAKAPMVVPVDKLPEKKEKTQTGEPTASDMAVASQMDLDPEDLKKYGMEVKNG